LDEIGLVVYEEFTDGRLLTGELKMLGIHVHVRILKSSFQKEQLTFLELWQQMPSI
jgi:hypothetical protein